MTPATYVIVVARNEAQRLAATLEALARAFPRAQLLLADDGSSDGTPTIARSLGARVVGSGSPLGKGAAATLAARAVLAETGARGIAAGLGPESANGDPEGSPAPGDAVLVLCDGDLGDSAAQLTALARALDEDEADVVVARFRNRRGGGFGVVVAAARWAIHRRCGYEATAPLSGQRALRLGALPELLPFAAGFGMEVGMTIDAVRAGHRVREIELDLEHRATGRTPAGFLHRARQLRDVLRAYRAREPSRAPGAGRIA